MSAETDRIYFRAWSALRRALRHAGVNPAVADSIRRRVHRSITGRDVGHRELAPLELGEVMAEFRRRALLTLWLCRLAQHAGVSEEGTAAYLDAVSRRLARCQFADLDSDSTGKLYGVMRDHADRYRAKGKCTTH